MRLYKKAAACLLTAAMAISMLTACGGGGNGGNGGGNTPTLPDDPKQIVLPDIGEGEGGGEGGGEGTETKPTKTPIADVHNSKLAKFNKKYAGVTEYYVEMQNVNYDEEGSAAHSTDARIARKDYKAYLNMTMSGKNQKQQSVEELILKEDKLYNTYLLLRDSKVAVKIDSDDGDDGDDMESLDSLITDKLPPQMWSAKVKVGPTEYDAEIFNLDYYEYTVCYTTDGNPVYKFVRDLRTKQLRTAFLYKTIQAGSGTSKGLCEMPAGTKTYSLDDDNGTLTDANGNVFTLVPQTNSEGDLTGFKVLDKTGKDVTNDFKWANDFFKAMSGQ